MKNIYVFLGTSGTGRSHTILTLGKVLSTLKKEVLVIDTTKSQGIYNYFNYNSEVEEKRALTKLNPVIRENMSILCDNPLLNNEKIGIDYNKLLKCNFDKFDYVLVETDENANKEFLNSANKIFLIQNSDKDKLLRNGKILETLNINSEKLVFVFNQLINGKFDKMYLFEYLISKIKNKINVINNGDIEISYLEEDVVTSLNNKADGRISLKNYSGDFKSSMYELLNIICEIDNRIYKKLMNNRRI